MSLGQDAGDLPFEMRAQTLPGARDSSPPAAASRCRSRDAPTCRTGSRRPTKARKAVQELAAKKVDIVKIWVDDRNGTVQEADARSLWRRSSTKRTSTASG